MNAPSDFPPVLVATPTQDWMNIHSVEAFLALQLPPGSEVVFQKGSLPVDAKRNALMQQFLDTPRFGATLLLDSDMTFRPDTALRLLAHQLPFVAVAGFSRLPPFHRVAFKTPTQPLIRTPEHRGLQPAWSVGAACVLVRRELVERMPRPWFQHPRPGEPWAGNGEDLFFCRQVEAAGVPLMVDLDVPLSHVGAVPVDGALSAAWQGLRRVTKAQWDAQQQDT
jgi:hypothetical protein